MRVRWSGCPYLSNPDQRAHYLGFLFVNDPELTPQPIQFDTNIPSQTSGAGVTQPMLAAVKMESKRLGLVVTAACG